MGLCPLPKFWEGVVAVVVELGLVVGLVVTGGGAEVIWTLLGVEGEEEGAAATLFVERVTSELVAIGTSSPV